MHMNDLEKEYNAMRPEWKKEAKKLKSDYEYYVKQCEKAENCHIWVMKKLVHRRKFFS